MDRERFIDARNILVIGVSWVGDTVLSLPAMKGLRRLFPEAYICLLARAHLGDLLREVGEVDEVIAYQPRKGYYRWADELRMVGFLRRKGFNMAVIFPRSFRSALVSYLAQIPIRIGYGGEGRGFLLTHGIPRTDALLRFHRTNYYSTSSSAWEGSRMEIPP